MPPKLQYLYYMQLYCQEKMFNLLEANDFYFKMD